MPDKRDKRQRFEDWLQGHPIPETHLSPGLSPEAHHHRHSVKLLEHFRDWHRENGERAFRNLYKAIAVLTCFVIVAVLLATVCFLPPFGSPDNPAHNEVSRKYLTDGVEDTGAVNLVAGMILDYRAFDTFGESCVLFTAAIAVIILLRNEGKRDAYDELLHEMEEPRHDIILQKVAMLLVPLILTFGIYVVLNGHLSPGGGFSGGAIMGAALILYASAYGTKKARNFYSFKTYRLVVSACLGFYALAKGYAFFMGANHLPSGIPLGTPGALLSAGLILPLNICVGLIVASTMYVLYVLFSKGEML